MKLRTIGLISTLVLGLLAGPLPVEAQQAGKMHRIGTLHMGSTTGPASAAFFERLRDLGYAEGRNIVIERRYAHGNRDRLAKQAAELVRLNVDVIVGPGGAAQAAVKATRTIPIVVAVAGDFVARGWAQSLRRPGGNVTGLSTQALGLMSKQLELLKETVPNLSRVAIVGVANHRGHAKQIHQAKETAPILGLGLVAIHVEDAADLPPAFRRMRSEGVDGIVVLRHGFLVRLRGQVVALAREAGLPTMFGHGREAAAGGLMAYGADTKALFRGAATYVDKILKGANPAELPISQARKFNLILNLKTAKQLGITIPPEVLLQATKVIK